MLVNPASLHIILSPEMSRLARPVLDKASKARREAWITIFLLVFGLASLATSVFQFWTTVAHWHATPFFDLIFLGLIWLAIAGASTAAVLYPVRDRRVFRTIIQVALWPLKAMVAVGYSYTFIAIPILSLAILVFLPLLVWSLLHTAGFLLPATEQASLYLILVATSIGFVQWGGKVAYFLIVRWLHHQQDFSRLYLLLRPPLVRVYTYLVMAGTYILANVEKFAGLTITTATWWVSYKDVLVEVLLTYVAIDSVIVAWRDYRGKTNKNAD